MFGIDRRLTNPLHQISMEKEPNIENSGGLSDDIIREVYDSLAAYESEIIEHNKKLLKNICKTAFIWFNSLIEGCEVTEKIEFVDKPDGSNCNETHGIFKEVWVRQWTGYFGDDYTGFIYARLKDNRWLKIPYSC